MRKSVPAMQIDDDDLDFTPPPWKRKSVSKPSSLCPPSRLDSKAKQPQNLDVLKEIKTSHLNHESSRSKASPEQFKHVVCDSKVMSAIWNLKSKPKDRKFEKSGRDSMIDDDDFQNSPLQQRDRNENPSILSSCACSLGFPHIVFFSRMTQALAAITSTHSIAIGNPSFERQPSESLTDIPRVQTGFRLSDEVEVSSHLAKNLKSHQEEGVAFMWRACIAANNGCILAHSMGLGKTLQVASNQFSTCVDAPI
jgi:SNF2 family DNA or RNA helicase